MLNSMNKLAIANTALSLIGSSTSIVGLEENSAESRAVLRHFDGLYTSFLAEHAWRFAHRIVELSLADVSINPGDRIPGWAHSYIYPADCVRMLNVMPFSQARRHTSDGKVGIVPEYISPSQSLITTTAPFLNPWETVLGATDRLIVANFPTATASYTSNAVPNHAHPAVWLEALTLKLAANIAPALRGSSENIVQFFMQLHVRAKAQAVAVDSGEAFEQADSRRFLGLYRPEAGVV